MVITMSKWALILNDQVHEITELDPTGRFSPDFVWVPCGDDVGERDSYDSVTGEFTKFELPPPPEPQLEATVEGEDLNALDEEN